MNRTAIFIIIAAVIVGGAIVLLKSAGNPSVSSGGSVNNVSLVDGVQIVTITARGGYQPRISLAKAGMPTILRFETNGTFDCSSAVRIPSLNISRALPQRGSTDIDIGTQQAGVLNGMCGMGMYPFEVQFTE